VLALAGPLAIASVVVVAGGLYKLRDPSAAASAFRSLHLPSSAPAIRLFGSGEVLLGSATLLLGGWWLAGVLAALYLAFAVVSWVLARARSSVSCGCFGSHSAEATGVHAVVNGVVAMVVAAAAVTGAPGFIETRSELAWGSLAFVALVAVGAWLLGAALTLLPDALAAARRVPVAHGVREFEIVGTTR
jgi:hypothetical protein